MALFHSFPKPSITRRRFLKAGLYGAGGLALYAGEVERHWVEVTEQDISLPGLPQAFDGVRVAQLSDIHLDEFTEPAFLRHVVDRVNRLQPDMVLLTGDYVSDGVGSKKFAVGAAWQCANILTKLECGKVYAVLGNHDLGVGADEVTAALVANGIPVLTNKYLPIERAGGRIWLAGLDDPLKGSPEPEQAVPAAIRNIPHEPVVLMCHAPDYVDFLLKQPAGGTVALMLSGHTHGGQVRLPFMGATQLPEMGRKYVEGWFRIGALQLYVNRGIGTIGVPFRFNCPPEITLFTLRTG
ncbi:MAG: metallophosphoesterase [Terracidiphilus sp.]|jgi:predicted MPP superfamily phosphohydrolase